MTGGWLVPRTLVDDDGRLPSALGIMKHTTRMIWHHPENHGVRARRMLRWAGWQAWERTVGRPRTVHFHGRVRMVCHPHDHIGSLAMYCGLYDSEEMRFLLAWLRSGDTFLDVGANVAPYSLLSTLVDGTRAIAFEPGSLARERAAENITLNGVQDRVELVPHAVTDTAGSARLATDRWATNKLVGDDYAGDSETVETVCIDSFVSDESVEDVSLMKIDVEGRELEVLRGARELLDRDRPALIVEHNHVDGLRSFAAGHGYTPVRYAPTTGALDAAGWPESRGGNLILVADLDNARRRLEGAPAAQRRQGVR